MGLNKNTRILIVGLGLMGGSYAQALTDRGFEVGALARREASINYALEHGLIRHGRCSAAANSCTLEMPGSTVQGRPAASSARQSAAAPE